jgi:hypothetical protein
MARGMVGKRENKFHERKIHYHILNRWMNDMLGISNPL